MTEGSTSTKTLYAGNYVYEKVNTNADVLKFFSHPEGYVDAENGFGYVYQYKDHLGNVRLSYSDSDLNGSINPSTEILNEKNYYPFGLEHKGYNNAISSNANSIAKKFSYNGQELEESLGLNVTEMTYRQYDAAIGRFNVIDAVAELAQNWTPYRFAFNNPILYADPSGLWEVGADGSWNTNDEKDIERFMNMLGFEADFYGGVSGAQMDTFIGEEFRGSGGRLSDGSALLDTEVIKGDSNGNSSGFSSRQKDNISQQVDSFVSNPWNEKSMGRNGGWAYSYKYYRERSYYENGGQGISGSALAGGALSIASDFMRGNGKFWLGKNLKFYDVSWGGNRVTGGKNKFAGKWASRISSASSVLGVIGMYSTYEEYQQGKLSGAGAVYLGGVDAAGATGSEAAMWSLGTGIGKGIVESSGYFNAIHNDINW